MKRTILWGAAFPVLTGAPDTVSAKRIGDIVYQAMSGRITLHRHIHAGTEANRLWTI